MSARPIRAFLAACLVAGLLVAAACSNTSTSASSSSSASSSAGGDAAQSSEAESSIDGTTVHVSAVQTSLLPETVARQYGIERAPHRILLLVNLRDLGAGPAPSITATVTDLQQHTAPVALRQVRVDPADTQTVDYVGTVEASLPDTLRFEVVVRRAGATATVRLSRDFFPQ